jgi:para-aminobenzoate synthetase/4-amino-4-deoxychorismate lyase
MRRSKDAESGSPGTVVLRRADDGCWLSFSRPAEVVTTRDPRDVLPLLRHLEEQVREKRRHAAGFLSYEAAPGFDPALRVRSSDDFPLLWFGLYEGFQEARDLPQGPQTGCRLDWRPSVTPDQYDQALHRVKDRIARGDTYQVNYTYRLRAPFEGDPWTYFLELARRARAGHAAYLDLGRWSVCCASPEMFFQLEAGTLVSRPMKGTAPRGLSAAEDEDRARWLQASAKNRSENIMIVDMIRNDMGKVAEIGSVSVPRLCEIERYPTLLQMTSTVQARVSAPPSEVLRALFPCASITGAPKVSTMGIIAEVESAPRGLYTGSIGQMAPDGGGISARFNVAIRTVVIDRRAGAAEYGVGGGILWESDPADEYRECEIKSRVLQPAPPPIELLEAILWTPQEGFFLLERHMKRLCESAAYFDIAVNAAAVRTALDELASGLPRRDHKVRLVVSGHGAPTLSAQPLEEIAKPAVQRVCLAGTPVSRSDVLLYHKTGHRALFQRELQAHPGCDDVILWNEDGEVTESCTANVVAQTPAGKVTPPVSSGLLPGTFRAHLLSEGSVTEGVLTREELRECRSIWLVNSVRKWMPAVLTEAGDDPAAVSRLETVGGPDGQVLQVSEG